ncbi:hypothetical protein L5515_002199 [Caenorhabditis briggsae]|uniref:Uncharacterized protein n=1 Tax=Caenorhabditis briggsae TaxID=6238 RepID=A0AAE9IZX2_CAEBR|nr:hypothetical protein L3Y34_016131 [Caenorhabditis briggsae]UMM14369.1 hypothetical protein L5515_002199 [Caenorhabditis briggsae]
MSSTIWQGYLTNVWPAVDQFAPRNFPGMSEPGTSTSSDQPTTTSDDWQIEYMNPFPPELQEINEELSDEEDEEEKESEDDRQGSMSPDTLENWKLLPPDDQFDLSMCSSDSKKKVRSLNLGVTRIQFNEGHLTVCVANRGFDNDETNKFSF